MLIGPQVWYCFLCFRLLKLHYWYWCCCLIACSVNLPHDFSSALRNVILLTNISELTYIRALFEPQVGLVSRSNLPFLMPYSLFSAVINTENDVSSMAMHGLIVPISYSLEYLCTDFSDLLFGDLWDIAQPFTTPKRLNNVTRSLDALVRDCRCRVLLLLGNNIAFVVCGPINGCDGSSGALASNVHVETSKSFLRSRAYLIASPTWWSWEFWEVLKTFLNILSLRLATI